MSESIKTVGDSKTELTVDAIKFYRDYWTISNKASESSVRDKANIIEFIFNEKPKDKKILEVGVGGEGGIINLLKEDNYVHGIDASESARINCEKFGIAVEVLNLDMNAIPYEEEYFDIVIAFEVMEHFSNPQFVIEEIKRVLKKTGSFLMSTPNPLIHHWPRLFYPPIFEEQHYEDFLIANELEIIRKIPFGTNIHANILSQEYLKSHSWIWDCKKIVDNPDSFFKYGLFFWERRDENGIRTRPIEAIEMFRKSNNLSNNSKIRSRFFYTLSLIYRFIYGEEKEFVKQYQYFLSMIKSAEYPSNMIATLLLLLINLEIRSLCTEEILDKESLRSYMRYLSSFPNSKPYIKAINNCMSQSGVRIDYKEYIDIFDRLYTAH
jgi:SAM-dependent methyltransferase